MPAMNIRRGSMVLSLGAMAMLQLFGLSANAKTIKFAIPNSVDILPININSSGDVAGWYEDADYAAHCFIWSPAVGVTSFDIPYGPRCEAVGIDDNGLAYGTYQAGRRQAGFVRAPDGTITTFRGPKGERSIQPQSNSLNGFVAGDVAGGKPLIFEGFVRDPQGHVEIFGPDGTIAWCVNDSGATAGNWGQNVGEAFLRQPDGTIVTFSVNSYETYPSHLNDKGQVVGFFYPPNEGDGFIRQSDGTLTTFVAPDAKYTYPYSINNDGTVVGWTYDGYSVSRGFVRKPEGTITIVLPRHATNSAIYGINDSGQMAGI